MKARNRFIRSVIAAAASCTGALPWERGARRRLEERRRSLCGN